MKEMAQITKDHDGRVPRHIGIIMDGNGRWAKKRFMPGVAGHRAGVKSVRNIVKLCGEKGVEALTLFAFSSENWRRPEKEVGLLMELFINVLQRETQKLSDENVCLRVIGDCSRFSPKLQNEIIKAEAKTSQNTGLQLSVAANYGGRWDVVNAVQQIAKCIEQGEMTAQDVTEEMIRQRLSMANLPEPDLFIRTGGEQRISNFLLWQLAYSELYFTDTLWPDFDAAAFETSLQSFASRERRFGQTSAQVETDIQVDATGTNK